MAELKDKIVLWASNGASLNSGVKARLATKFQEDGLEWLAFVWCVSHHLRVIIKWKFWWCARTSQRKSYSLVLLVSQVVQKDKVRELCKLHSVLKDFYNFEGNQVKPSKAKYVWFGR